MHSGGSIGRHLKPTLKTVLPLLKNVLKPLARRVLIPMRLAAAAVASDLGIHKRILGSEMCPSDLAQWRALIASNKEMDEIMKKKKCLK